MVQSCKDDSKPAPESINEIETRIGHLIDEIHRLIQGIRPPILDDYGLSSALARLTEEVSSYSGIKIDYQYISSPDLGRLPSRVELPLYRIAQEAVTNVVRHAGSEQASVVVIRRREDVVLLVEDHGCGFDPGSQKDSSRLGLAGMKERTALLGGSCVLESLPGKGTTLRVSIPLG
jgi:signal transduction histidine kinase